MPDRRPSMKASRSEAATTKDPATINIAGAVRLALERGPGQTIATVLCDSGAKYQSKLFNREWQAANGLRADVSVDTLVAKL